jgi:hypothetical protein
VDVAVVVGIDVGAEVMGKEVVEWWRWWCRSLQPKKKPGVLHVSGSSVCFALVLVEVAVGAGSLQPHQPGTQVVEPEAVVVAVCVVVVVASVAGMVVVVMVVFFSSLQPNQPGDTQVVVV